MPAREKPSEVLYEFIPMGAYVKVCAVDAKSGTEVTVVGDARATQAELQRTALRKLEFVMAKKSAPR